MAKEYDRFLKMGQTPIFRCVCCQFQGGCNVLHPGWLTAGTYKSPMKGTWSEPKLHEDMFLSLKFRGVFSILNLNRNKSSSKESPTSQSQKKVCPLTRWVQHTWRPRCEWTMFFLGGFQPVVLWKCVIWMPFKLARQIVSQDKHWVVDSWCPKDHETTQHANELLEFRIV